MADYTRNQIAESLCAVGLRPGAVVYCHSNIGFFGTLEGVTRREELCEAIFDAVMTALGPAGPLIVPTYTYSFSNGQSFDPGATASKMGLFAEWVRRHPDSLRSVDPCFSVAAIGPLAQELCTGLPPNSFAPDSTFGRFLALDGTLLNLNHPGCTLLHHVERELRVPYRFDKAFEGELVTGGHSERRRWEIFVRYLSDPLLAHDPWPFIEAMARAGLSHRQALGRGEVLTMSARNVFATVEQGLSGTAWFLTAACRAGRTPHLDVSCR